MDNIQLITNETVLEILKHQRKQLKICNNISILAIMAVLIQFLILIFIL